MGEIRNFLSRAARDKFFSSGFSVTKLATNAALYLCSRIYQFGFTLDRWRKLPKLTKINGADLTISVGNITWGGTGKTPMIKLLCGICLSRDFLPIVVSRVTLCVLLTSKGYGEDETLMLEDFAKRHGFVCGFGKDRYSIIKKLLLDVSKNSLLSKKKKIVLLDDAMQTHQVHRDLNIVMIHAQDPFGNGNLIPRGILRETKRVSTII